MAVAFSSNLFSITSFRQIWMITTSFFTFPSAAKSVSKCSKRINCRSRNIPKTASAAPVEGQGSPHPLLLYPAQTHGHGQRFLPVRRAGFSATEPPLCRICWVQGKCTPTNKITVAAVPAGEWQQLRSHLSPLRCWLLPMQRELTQAWACAAFHPWSISTTLRYQTSADPNSSSSKVGKWRKETAAHCGS